MINIDPIYYNPHSTIRIRPIMLISMTCAFHLEGGWKSMASIKYFTSDWASLHSSRRERTSGYSFPLLLAYIVSLGSVEDLEELGHPMPHSTVHVCFGAFDMVV